MILLHSRLENDRMKREQHICMNPDAKTFWSFVNRYLNRKRPINSINHGSTPVKDPSRIANIFNEFFSSIFAPFSPLPEFNDNDTSSYTLTNSLTNFTVSFDQTNKIISSLPSKSSVDPSGLSYRIIKNGGPMLTHYLTYLFSLSTKVGRVPSAWKVAVVAPILKGGVSTDINNYRPISITIAAVHVFSNALSVGRFRTISTLIVQYNR